MPTDPRIDYYAAAIVSWLTGRSNKYFEFDDLSTWGPDPAEPFEEMEPFLSNKSLTLAALDRLVELEILGKVVDRFGPSMFSLVDNNPLQRLFIDDEQSAFGKTYQFGQQWILRAIQRINSDHEQPPDSQPASDDMWEPLQVDTAAKETTEAIASIEKAIRELAADNGFSATYPAERDNIVNQATVTVESLKSGFVTKGQLRQNIVAAGRWIADKFGGSAIGAIGAELIKWGLRLLGVPI